MVVGKLAANIDVALRLAPRRIFVVYYNPVAAHCFDALGSLNRFSPQTWTYAAQESGFGQYPMDLKQIESFVRVAELGSFTRAVAALGIALTPSSSLR
jgi:hypothetical protein